MGQTQSKKKSNGIIDNAMKNLKTFDFEKEPEFKLTEILNEDEVDRYIEIREMFDQIMECENVKEAMVMAMNRTKLTVDQQLALLAVIDFRSSLVIYSSSEYNGSMYG